MLFQNIAFQNWKYLEKKKITDRIFQKIEHFILN